MRNLLKKRRLTLNMDVFSLVFLLWTRMASQYRKRDGHILEDKMDNTEKNKETKKKK